MPVPRSEYLSSVWKDGIFNDRVVFVTGGAGTICSAQTRAMVTLGANACIVGRNVEKTESMALDIATARPGAKVLGLGGVDVRSFDSLKEAADRCVRELGGLDYCVAGAAGNFVAPMSRLTPNGFKAVVDIDVLGTFNTIKAVMPHLVASAAKHPGSGGRIIAIGVTFHYTGVPFQAHVAAAKAGVDSLMASVALEYGPLGVHANIITPGAIEGTEGLERLAGAAVLNAGKNDAAAAFQKDMQAAIPSGRWGTVKDIADATVYLFSDAANYVNGEVLVVDGAGWRRQGAGGVGLGPGMRYPDYVIRGNFDLGGKKDRERKGASKL